jgi:hypothetical protein
MSHKTFWRYHIVSVYNKETYAIARNIREAEKYKRDLEVSHGIKMKIVDTKELPAYTTQLPRKFIG